MNEFLLAISISTVVSLGSFILRAILKPRQETRRNEIDLVSLSRDDFNCIAAHVKNFAEAQCINSKNAPAMNADLVNMSNLPQIIRVKPKPRKAGKIRRGYSIAGAYRNPPLEPPHELDLINRLSDLNRTKSNFYQ